MNNVNFIKYLSNTTSYSSENIEKVYNFTGGDKQETVKILDTCAKTGIDVDTVIGALRISKRANVVKIYDIQIKLLSDSRFILKGIGRELKKAQKIIESNNFKVLKLTKHVASGIAFFKVFSSGHHRSVIEEAVNEVEMFLYEETTICCEVTLFKEIEMTSDDLVKYIKLNSQDAYSENGNALTEGLPYKVNIETV